MTITASVLPPAVERHLIHEASCRYRKQGLVCSTCTELAERAQRIAAAARLAEVAA